MSRSKTDRQYVDTSFCTCGQLQADAHAVSTSTRESTMPRKTPSWLESSFVHLVTPQRPQHLPFGKQTPHVQHGFLEPQQHIDSLLEATSPENGIPLCAECIQRVAAALEADTERLYAEAKAYKDSVNEADRRAKTFDSISRVNINETERAYEEEIAILQQEVEAREAELAHLDSLFKEQKSVSKELDTFADSVQLAQNCFELQSRSFDDSAKLLSKTLKQVQTEVDQLSIVRLPLSLFDLQVDERGLRYPLINQLRLAFRPKGDASDAEIRAAWSQATQLLLILGTLIQYPASEWKLVPLADCAKLIYRKQIFNMEPGDCRSLLAWNALLDQVIRHAKSLFAAQQATGKKLKPPPFPSSPSTIGTTELARLDRGDSVGWSQVIQQMASNLLWLSEQVSELVALQVSTLAHSVA